MKKKTSVIILGVVVGLAAMSGIAIGATVQAEGDSVVDQVNITVPISCTMTGTGMNTHNADINNGQLNSSIGETTMKAFCNDSGGFAIYAIGYTDNTAGKNVLTSSTLGSDYDIATGTATGPVGNVDTSAWAMRLNTITSPAPSYPITIAGSSADAEREQGDPDYSTFQAVPDDYTLVAKRTSGTDIGQSAEGSTLKTTYQAYISKTQPAGTYTGQVKYTLVHPSTAPQPVNDNQIGVIYDGNGLYFDQAGTRATNRVVYEEQCEDEYGYIANTPAVVHTENLDADGNQDGSYYRDYEVFLQGDSNYFEDASKLKVEIYYKINNDTHIYVYGGDFSEGFSCQEEGCEGTLSYVLDSNSAILFYDAYGESTPGYDYGIIARLYPIYSEPTADTTYGLVRENVCGFRPVNGAYAETIPWYGYWYIEDDDYVNKFYYETVDEYDNDYRGIVKYLDENKNSLSGSNITVYAYNPYKILYDGNGATTGTMSGFYTELLFNTEKSNADLMAYNFKKTGYGFAGWSTDPNASVNGSDKIYGPNERVTGNEFTFDPSTRETTLYAVWVPSSGNMQSFSCNSLSSGQVTALTDTRDNNVYAVGKMQDGNCWMMENLRLDAANSTDSTKAQGFGGVFAGLADSEDANFGTGSLVANSKYDTSNITGSDRWYRFPRYNNNNTNFGGTNSFGTTLIASPDDDNNHAQWYGYGNNYTWAAAMANTERLASISQSESANTSICPTGWQLPYGNYTGKGAGSGGFSYLDIQMGGTGNTQRASEASERWRSFPNNIIYAGFWNGSSDEGGQISAGRGSGGDYWSTSAESYRQAYFLSVNSDYVNPGFETWWSYKDEANSVRCITGVSQT